LLGLTLSSDASNIGRLEGRSPDHKVRRGYSPNKTPQY
jgi:hypothetical protein